MSKATKSWAKAARIELIVSRGGACERCKALQNLTIHVLARSDQRHHGMDPSARICYYRKEARAGNIQVLCQACHQLVTMAGSKQRATPAKERIINILWQQAE